MVNAGIVPHATTGKPVVALVSHGGTAKLRNPDLDEYDREMLSDRRAAVLLVPRRFSTNPAPPDREE